MSLAPVAGAASAAAPATPAYDRRPGKRRAAWRRRGLVLLLMSPWLVGFFVFVGYPLVMSAYLSFNHYDLVSSPRWIGFANYRYLFTVDQQIWPAVYNTFWMILIAVPLQVLFAFGLAVMLARARRGVGALPHRLLPPGARAAGRGDARLRLPAEPGDGTGQRPARAPRDPGPALVPVARVVEAVAHPAQPLGRRRR